MSMSNVDNTALETLLNTIHYFLVLAVEFSLNVVLNSCILLF